MKPLNFARRAYYHRRNLQCQTTIRGSSCYSLLWFSYSARVVSIFPRGEAVRAPLQLLERAMFKHMATLLLIVVRSMGVLLAVIAVIHSLICSKIGQIPLRGHPFHLAR